MAGTARRNKIYVEMSPVAIAILVDKRLLDDWPLEITKRGEVMMKRAPETNVWHRALHGDGSGLLNFRTGP